MQAGMEGAGRDKSIGVSIRLPFETGANEIIAGDQKLVSMKYFFTRKLMLMKESKGFISLPGGFGTLDEVFELLTLQQTGKADPAPIVLIDFPGDHYWEAWERWVRDHVASKGLISPEDLDLVLDHRRRDRSTRRDDRVLAQLPLDSLVGGTPDHPAAGRTDRRRGRHAERAVRPPLHERCDRAIGSAARGDHRRRRRSTCRGWSCDSTSGRSAACTGSSSGERVRERSRARELTVPLASRSTCPPAQKFWELLTPSFADHNAQKIWVGLGGPWGGARTVSGLDLVVGLGEDVDGLLDRPSCSGQALLVDRELVAAGVDRLSEPHDGEVGQLLGDALRAVLGCRRTRRPSRQCGACASALDAGWLVRQ